MRYINLVSTVFIKFRQTWYRKFSTIDRGFLIPFLGPFLIYVPELVRGRALFWGTPILQFIPWRHLAYEMIRAGTLPLWNIYSGLGTPLLANYQSGLLYPPNWVLFIFDSLGGIEWLVWGHTMLVMIHLGFAGWGMAKFIKYFGVAELGQIIGGLAFGLSGYLVTRSGFFSMNSAIAWLPWIMLFSSPGYFGKHSFGISKRFLILSLLWCFQLLSGHAQITWYTFMISSTWMIFSGWISLRQVQRLLIKIKLPRLQEIQVLRYPRFETHIFHNFLALILGVFLAAPQLLPTFEYFISSQRNSGVTPELAMTYSFWPWRILTLLAPDLFGNPIDGNYWGYGNYWEDALYIGVLPLLFFLSRIGDLFGDGKISINYIGEIKKREFTRFWLLAIVIFFMLGLGKNFPLFLWLYKNIPTFSLFQAPTRFNLVSVFGLALLAGIGVDSLRKPEGRKLYWTRLGTAGTLAIMVVALIGFELYPHFYPTIVLSIAKLGGLLFSSGIIFLAPTFSLSRIKSDQMHVLEKPIFHCTIWQWVILIFIILDLAWFGWRSNPFIDIHQFSKANQAQNSITFGLSQKRVYLSASDEYSLLYEKFFRFDTYYSIDDWTELYKYILPNINLMNRIYMFNNFDPLVTERYSIWRDKLDDLKQNGNSSQFSYLLNLSGIQLVENINPNTYSFEMTRLFGDFSRVRWVPCAYYASEKKDILELILRNDPQSHEYVFLEEQIHEPATCTRVYSMPYITVLEDTNNHLVVRVSASKDGWLVFLDNWYPGWRVEVNGKYVQDYKADYLFRAAEIGPGESIVEMKYHPVSLISGSIIFIVAILFWLILWMRID